MLRFIQHPKKTDLPVTRTYNDFKPKKRKIHQKRLYAIVGFIIVVLLFILTRSDSKVPPAETKSIQQGTGKVTRIEPKEPKESKIEGERRGEDVTRLSGTGSDESLPDTVEIYDLNNYQGTPAGKEEKEKVLLLIPLRNAAKVLPLMFRNMMNMTYDHSLIDIAFLVSDCSEGDKTLETLFQYSQAMQEGKLLQLLDEEEKTMDTSGIKGSSDLYLQYMPEDYVENVKQAYSPPYHSEYTKPFRSVEIYQKDFGQVIGQGFSDRHDVKVQGIRRKLMGRARNWLVSAALKPYHSWVYWRDADIETSPGDILESMMRFSSAFDVVVPNVWRPLPTFLGNEQPYDLNSWMESSEGLELAKSLTEDDVIVEGYAEYPTWRVHLAYIREANGNQNEIIDLDGVGGVSILSRAKVFRQGSNFPAFTFMNHAETEAFGKLSKAMGFRVGGLPHYTIWHIYEPSEDDLLQISRMERRKRRYRGSK